MQTIRIPIYLVGAPDPVATPPSLRIVTSWDGSLYGECNVPDLCGPSWAVYPGTPTEHIAIIWDKKGQRHYMCCNAYSPSYSP